MRLLQEPARLLCPAAVVMQDLLYVHANFDQALLNYMQSQCLNTHPREQMCHFIECEPMKANQQQASTQFCP